ncbi:MAG: hypothetical protein HY023_16160 [Chloroflexi bacterium]|nr:hypothetical protein [Chloroflexota bacterium]
MNLAFLKDPRVRLALTLLVVLGVIVGLNYGLPWESPIGFAVDIFGFGFMFVTGLILIAQFSLPVASWDERVQAISRIFGFAFGDKGPVVFVKDGKLVGTPEELKRAGAGVILVDNASAVVLEKGLKFSRACGPGVVYMKPHETIKATLDLRKQSRNVPASALTKDGIKVETTIGVTFKLAAGGEKPEGAGGAASRRWRPYSFNARSAFQAVYGGAVGKDVPLAWTDLPPLVAAEHFRDLLARQKLDDLFRPSVSNAFPETMSLGDFIRRLSEDVSESPVLREHGIQVFGVSVGAFDLHAEVQKQRVLTWEAEWKKRAEIKLVAGEAEADKIKQRARYTAREEVDATLMKAMSDRTAQMTAEDKRDIGFRIMEAVRQLMSDSETRKSFRGIGPGIFTSVRDWLGLSEEEFEQAAEGEYPAGAAGPAQDADGQDGPGAETTAAEAGTGESAK